MDALVNTLGILGSCFAVILVLSVAVETILEPFTLIKGLRKRLNPAELVNDLNDWVTGDSMAGQKVEELAKLTKRSQAWIKEIRKSLQEVAAVADNAAELFGQNADEIKKQFLSALSKYQHGIKEQTRIVILRCMAAAVGMAIAWVLQINAIELISGLLPAATVKTLSTPAAHIGGILLTGLAASAGSSFWHDQLAKVRAAKTIVSAK